MLTSWFQNGVTSQIPVSIQLHSTAFAIASGFESSEGSFAGAWTNVIADAQPANNWSGPNVFDSTVNDYLGQQWVAGHQVKEVWLRMNRWSRSLRFRVGNSLGTLTTLRTISLQTPTNDDNGVAVVGTYPTNQLSQLDAVGGYNKFTLPEYVAAKYFVIDAPTYASSIIGDLTAGPNSRLGVHKCQLWGI